MPIWADPAHGDDVRLLADDDLTLLATFVVRPAPVPLAEDLRVVPGTDYDRFAEVAVRDLPGVRVVTGVDEAFPLVQRGATVERSTVRMARRRLQDDPPPLPWAALRVPDGFDAVALGEVRAADLAEAREAAYPPGHPDREQVLAAHADDLNGLRRLLAGAARGPVLDDASAAVVDPAGRVVGAVVVVRGEPLGTAWPGGPWVAEHLVVPGSPLLLGRGLLARALAVLSLDGEEAVGLSASATDRAQLLYRRLGFEELGRTVAVTLPGSWPGR